jgi:hypothetical protein
MACKLSDMRNNCPWTVFWMIRGIILWTLFWVSRGIVHGLYFGWTEEFLLVNMRRTFMECLLSDQKNFSLIAVARTEFYVIRLRFIYTQWYWVPAGAYEYKLSLDGPTRSSHTIVSKDGRRSWIVIWVIRFVFYFICTRASVAGTIDNAATLVSPTAQPFSAGAFYCIPSFHKTHHRVARTDGCRRRTSWQEARATQSHPMSERCQRDTETFVDREILIYNNDAILAKAEHLLRKTKIAIGTIIIYTCRNILCPVGACIRLDTRLRRLWSGTIGTIFHWRMRKDMHDSCSACWWMHFEG